MAPTDRRMDFADDELRVSAEPRWSGWQVQTIGSRGNAALSSEWGLRLCHHEDGWARPRTWTPGGLGASGGT